MTHIFIFEKNFCRVLIVLAAFAFMIGCGGDSSDDSHNPVGLGGSGPDVYVESQDYIVLEQPVRTADPSRIEVAVVFSYSSPGCYKFEPLLQAWEQQLPGDVYVERVHAMWNPSMEPLIRGYYSLKTLGIEKQAHMEVFNAIFLEHRSFNSAEGWANFFSRYGVNPAKTFSTYNSFAVTSLVKRAEAQARGFKITGVPQLVVNGKYRISSRFAGGSEEMLNVAAYLASKERTGR